MSKRSERVKTWRYRTKSRLIKAFGGKCGICGYDKCDDVFEFHHINSKEKEFGLGSARGNTISWERMVNEVRKCVMLCSNCHKEVHSSRSNTIIPENITRFNERFADYKPHKAIVFDKCPVCDGVKNAYHTACSPSCRAKLKQKVDWDAIDLITLVEQYKNYEKIGDMLGITGAAVSRHHRKLLSSRTDDSPLD